MIKVREHRSHTFGTIQRNRLSASGYFNNNDNTTITNLIIVSFRNNSYRDLVPKVEFSNVSETDHIETAENHARNKMSSNGSAFHRHIEIYSEIDTSSERSYRANLVAFICIDFWPCLSF